MKDFYQSYTTKLSAALDSFDVAPLERLADALELVWKNKNRLFLCGNGGSAGNADHLANDFTFGVGRAQGGIGLNVTSLSSNSAVLTCLANDIGYENIYSHQLKVQAQAGDVLVAFSGSGNSPNILNAIETANKLDMHSFAILGYDGGKAKNTAHESLHLNLDDMQIAEDFQLIVGHMLMKYLAGRV